MKPFIINSHLNDGENQVLLFIPHTKFNLMPKRQNSNVILFADELKKHGHQVLEFGICKFFAGHDGSEKDGGYIFTIIPEEYYGKEEQLLKDTYLILKNLGSL